MTTAGVAMAAGMDMDMGTAIAEYHCGMKSRVGPKRRGHVERGGKHESPHLAGFVWPLMDSLA